MGEIKIQIYKIDVYGEKNKWIHPKQSTNEYSNNLPK